MSIHIKAELLLYMVDIDRNAKAKANYEDILMDNYWTRLVQVWGNLLIMIYKRQPTRDDQLSAQKKIMDKDYQNHVKTRS